MNKRFNKKNYRIAFIAITIMVLAICAGSVAGSLLMAKESAPQRLQATKTK